MMSVGSVFLTAEWRYLVMANYEIDPYFLTPHVPIGTSLDDWSSRYYVSLVAFRFLNTKVLGVAIPWHRNFDEINLRFYVRREAGDEVRRGVVFLKEVVPRWAIAAVARWAYNENYVSCRTHSDVNMPEDGGEAALRYSWTPRGMQPIAGRAVVKGHASLVAEASEEQFITEHYWGYAVQRDGSTVEYQVEHEPWRIWRTDSWELSGPVGDFYGEGLASFLSHRPSSVFVADGSPVAVRRGKRIVSLR